LAFPVTVSEHSARQRRHRLIRAHKRTTLRAPLSKSMLCCRCVRNAFGFALTHFAGPRKSNHCLGK
jgi:hypothetical protein